MGTLKRVEITEDEAVCLRRLAYLGYLDGEPPVVSANAPELVEKGMLAYHLTPAGIAEVMARGGGMATDLSDRTDVRLPSTPFIPAEAISGCRCHEDGKCNGDGPERADEGAHTGENPLIETGPQFVANVTITKYSGLDGNLIDVVMRWAAGNIERQAIIAVIIVNLCFAVTAAMTGPLMLLGFNETDIGASFIGWMFSVLYAFVHVPVALVYGAYALERWWDQRSGG